MQKTNVVAIKRCFGVTCEAEGGVLVGSVLLDATPHLCVEMLGSLLSALWR
jgi:hypothetical protein